MAKIFRIRQYMWYDEEWYDIMYESGRLVSYPVESLPKTAQRWMVDKEWDVQYDKLYKRNEVIYHG